MLRNEKDQTIRTGWFAVCGRPGGGTLCGLRRQQAGDDGHSSDFAFDLDTNRHNDAHDLTSPGVHTGLELK